MGETPVVPIIAQSLEVFPLQSTKDTEYADRDSNLGDDESRILMHDDHNIPSDGDGGMDDNESTSLFTQSTVKRLDKTSLFYFTFPEEIPHGIREDEDGDKQMDGNKDFILIRNMELSHPSLQF